MIGYVICGATATGKTNLGIELAKKVHGEIISADSRQIYKYLNIGTAKVTPEETQEIPHHLIDIFEPSYRASVVDVATQAHVVIEDCMARNITPIIVGGTGFYIDAFIKEMLPDVPEVSDNTLEKYTSLSTEEIKEHVRKLDPILALSIDTTNRDRMIRALSIIDHMGTIPAKIPVKFSQPIEWTWIGLSIPRNEHQELIKNSRATRERTEAIIAEAQQLLDANFLTLERCEELGLEYKLAAQYIKGELSLEEFQQQLFHKICQYAKRQETWFKRNQDIQWFNPLTTSNEEIIKSLIQ
ncbi:MAG TPA: tRNA (adenosine(37)-N6)-dimethylallyltransferase MiaA [Candidatus Paceibacterota bacterium]